MKGARGAGALRGCAGAAGRAGARGAAFGLASALALAALPAGASAQTVSVRAEAGASARVFPSAPAFDGQRGARLSPSLTLAPEVVVELGDGSWSVVAEGFVRLDAHDRNRSHVDARDLGVRWYGSSASAFVGLGQVFWGVTEARHLVDVVNQVDAVEDLDGEDKLGQPMVSLTFDGSWGALDLYYLPWFRERSFPAAEARLRGPLPVADAAWYESRHGRWAPGFAARIFRAVGALDVGVSAFRGTSREPRLGVVADAQGAPLLQARYDEIDQVGLDAQWTGDGTLWKLEAMTRGGHASRLYAVTGGFEHTLYQLFGGASDLGLIGEVALDSRGPDAPPTIFDHDVFVGGRWAWNDVSDTSVLGGPLVDVETGEIVVLLEAERRLGSLWSLEAEARLFGRTDPASLVHGLRDDGFMAVSLTRYF